MIEQVTLRGEAFGAAGKLAAERFLTRMNSHVGLQVAVFGESTTANLALKWLFTGMGSHVDLEAARARVLLVADGALVGFLARMYQYVRVQMALGDEALPAALIVARIGTIVRVRTHMRLQITRLIELFETEREAAEEQLVSC